MGGLNGHDAVDPFEHANGHDVEATVRAAGEGAKSALGRGLLERVLVALARAEIEYCLLRDEPSRELFDSDGEVDLLVAHGDRERLGGVLGRLGFAEMRAWGHAPHRFYIAYDDSRDIWLKLDVVDRLAFGTPVRALETPLGGRILRNRCAQGPTFVPAPEDACVVLLLHCALDKQGFSERRRADLERLCAQVRDEEYASALLAEYWLPTMTWGRFASLVGTGRWASLLAERSLVAARLCRRDRIGTLVRRVRGLTMRKLNRLMPRFSERPLAVALLAPDGAGKSTLAEGLRESFYFPVRSVYMGLYGKDARKPRLAFLPGAGFAFRVVQQWGRYLRAMYHRLRGRFVIFDRYTYDALLGATEGRSPLKRLRRWLLAHACPAPDLVFILDAPADVLYARKGEHDVARLERQRRRYLELQSRLATCAVVDASADPADVRRAVTGMIWNRFTCTTKLEQ